MGSFIGNPIELNYGFVYVAHSRAVTHISWRKTSKYMPKGSVSNMLVTSCLDNICRIWVETVLPDDGLVNMNQFDPLASQNPKFRTHRHKHRFMQRLKHMKTCFHIRRHAKHHAGTGLSGMAAGFGGLGTINGFGQPPIPTLPSTYSVHDFHSYGYHGTGVTPGLHFHLAASINAETDIPLVPSMQTNDPATQPNFILHWLNNKEMHFSLQAEGIMHEMARKFMEKDDINNLQTGENSNSEHSEDNHNGVAPDEVKRKLNKMNKSMSHDDSQHSDEVHPQQQQQHANRSHSIGGGSHAATVPPSLSNTTSIQSLMTDGHPGQSAPNTNIGTDSLDMKIECLLRDWHHNPDLLFSIHPIDGSFLIWVIEWLDEYHPGAFRQAQVSFSTRIPAAFPLGDAMSMSTTVSLYSSGINYLHFRDMVIKGATKTGPASTTKENSTKDQVDGDTGTPLPSVQEEQDADEQAENDIEEAEEKKPGNASPNDSGNVNDVGHFHGSNDMLMAPPSPTISMVSKHANGTLNLWQLTFADKSKFSQVLSIGHASRASGHRFRVNDITCHPVLPLLLTTSHHNVPELSNQEDINESTPRFTADKLTRGKDVCVPLGFCSELILWRVDAVGPLSQSGGVSELARINSPEISAFSNVAWIPTLLPSTTLGNLSNSPSACFVASDGESLRVYQAVIDARTLLAEISSSERRHRLMTDSMISLSTECSSVNDAMLHHQSPLHDKIKIVSQQSTARPGCIIQLDAIDDATHDWQNTQFLHVFQEQLITGERTDSDSSGLVDTGSDPMDLIGGLMEKEKDAMVDLQRNSVFEEPFYIVVLERTPKGTTVHMWRIVIASQPVHSDELSSSMMYVPDSNIVQDLDEPEELRAARQSTAGLADANLKAPPGTNDYCPRVNISTTKVCTQELPLPEGVDVVHASPAAGHLSSSSIYPACFAPYIIVTACSDSKVRFWKCKVSKKTENPAKFKYEWREWDMIRKDQESTIEINGQLMNISAAYSGRIACAYKYGKSFTRPTKADPESRYVNLCVAIYECESTGGSEWVLEDTIHLKNIHLPQIQVDPHLDLSYLYDQKSLVKKQRLQQVLHPFTHDDLARSTVRPGGSQNSINNGDLTPETLKVPSGNGMLAVPSFSTLQSLRKSITENGNTCPLTQKHLVQLDWVSKEDGSHILTVAVGSKIMLFTPVSSDLAQANMKAMKESQTANRPLLRKASSLARPHFNDEIRWMKLRQIELKTADGLPPLPMQISWVRDGIFVAGMDSEMHVYSQWKPREYEQILHHHLESVDNYNDSRCLRDEDLRSLVTESNQRRLANVSSMPHLSRISTTNLQLFGQDKKKKNGVSSGMVQDVPVNYDYMNDFGLFEASRIACPVLPQYHPKQLMELLNSGKIRWVKAILAHLVRCISGSCAVRGAGNEEESLNRQQVS